MKNIFFILLACLAVTMVHAEQDANLRTERRNVMIERYLRQKMMLDTEDAYGNTPVFSAAKSGDVRTIAKLADQASNGTFLLRKDKFGNTVFHVAKDAQTVQALAAAMRKFDAAKINEMKNWRNNAGETPLQAHINYGRTDTFRLFYEGSELEAAIRAVQAVDRGGALSATAEIKKEAALRISRDASGRTVAQAARDNASVPGMDQIVAFFQTNASYL